MNLFELTSNYLFLQELLEDPDVDSQSIIDSMDAISDEIEVKADGYAKVIRNMEGSIAAIKQEQERLANKRNLLEMGIKRLKENLQQSMVLTGKTKFKTDLFSFNIQKNGGKAPVVLDKDIAELPEGFLRIKKEADLEAIRLYLEQKGSSEYAHLGERGESLRIK